MPAHLEVGTIERQRLPDRLVERLVESIERGDLRPGDRLPSIAEMALRFGVSRPTVRFALAQLEFRRMVEIRHGYGVLVIGTGAPAAGD